MVITKSIKKLICLHTFKCMGNLFRINLISFSVSKIFLNLYAWKSLTGSANYVLRLFICAIR